MGKSKKGFKRVGVANAVQATGCLAPAVEGILRKARRDRLAYDIPSEGKGQQFHMKGLEGTLPLEKRESRERVSLNVKPKVKRLTNEGGEAV